MILFIEIFYSLSKILYVEFSPCDQCKFAIVIKKLLPVVVD